MRIVCLEMKIKDQGPIIEKQIKSLPTKLSKMALLLNREQISEVYAVLLFKCYCSLNTSDNIAIYTEA